MLINDSLRTILAAKVQQFFDIRKRARAFPYFLFKRQIRSDAFKVRFGQFSQYTQVIDRREACALTAKRVDGFGLSITQVGVAL